MADPRFTPGPWFICGDPSPNDHWYPGRTIGSEPDGTRICDLPSARNKEGNDANAHLIAAAPDLYEALEFALETPGMIKGRDKARAALAKARGEG